MDTLKNSLFNSLNEFFAPYRRSINRKQSAIPDRLYDMAMFIYGIASIL